MTEKQLEIHNKKKELLRMLGDIHKEIVFGDLENERFKEKIIKETIDLYEGIIAEPYYSRLKKAMYNYKVEITD